MGGARFEDWEIGDLLAAVAEQDRAAYAELYRRTSAKLYAVAFRILGDAAKTDDAVHDVFVRVWHSAGSYDAMRGRPITWLATMARNMSIDIRRRDVARGAGHFVDVALDEIVDRGGGASSEQLAALKACLARLEPDQRQLVIAAYLNGDSREELAERAARPIGTIKSWLHRSLALLKACLDG